MSRAISTRCFILRRRSNPPVRRAKLRLDLVTRDAQPVGSDLRTNGVGQAPGIGLMRVISKRAFQLCWRAIDLPPEPSPSDVELLWSELISQRREREIALRGEARYVQRLDRGRPSREQWLDPALPLRLESRERGRLDTLRFTPFELPQCGPGQVLIDVKAAGMNFRDVLKALALYPGDAPDARIFGDEVAGIVRQVGSGVTHVAPGDRVFGLAVFGIATQTLARARRRATHSGEPVFRGSGDATGRLHDFVACVAKRGATARGRTHPRTRGRGRRWDGRDSDRASTSARK